MISGRYENINRQHNVPISLQLLLTPMILEYGQIRTEMIMLSNTLQLSYA